MATSSGTSHLDADARQRLRRRLLNWYARHRRDLPWRDNRDPYRVWVSEVMLQQTQVAKVKDYFPRFVAAFPTVHALAAADEAQVLRRWEGLGYYRRARQLHAAARLLVDKFSGQFPDDVDALQQLPGIGRYTAGAIASIAFDRRAPILEANTIRLLSRLVGYRHDPTKAAGQRLLWQVATDILPRQHVAQFNQALMELGSLVCTPNKPDCAACPLREICACFAHGWQDEIPVAKQKQQFTSLHEAAVVVRKNGHVLLRQCAQGERWAGLWDFPRFEVGDPASPHREMIDRVRALTGITCQPGSVLTTIKHGVTRYRITLDCYTAKFASGRLRSNTAAPVRWVQRQALEELPLSTTGRKIASSICSQDGSRRRKPAV